MQTHSRDVIECILNLLLRDRLTCAYEEEDTCVAYEEEDTCVRIAIKRSPDMVLDLKLTIQESVLQPSHVSVIPACSHLVCRGNIILYDPPQNAKNTERDRERDHTIRISRAVLAWVSLNICVCVSGDSNFMLERKREHEELS
jgi:hypothetical protein